MEFLIPTILGIVYIIVRTKVNVWDIFAQSVFKSEIPFAFRNYSTFYFLFTWFLFALFVVSLLYFTELNWIYCVVISLIVVAIPFRLGGKRAIRKYRNFLSATFNYESSNTETIEFARKSLQKSDKELFDELTQRDIKKFFNR